MDKYKINNEYWETSVHTQISYWTCLIAISIQLVIGLRNIGSLFGQLCIVEFLFGLSGLLLLDPLHGKKGKIYPETFKKIHPNLFFRFAITFGVTVVIQFVFQIIPLITSTEFALAVVFCAPCEEYFFRGILMEPIFKYGKKAQKFNVWEYKNKRKNRKPKQMSYIELGGIFLSAAIFAAFHVNYYGQNQLMGMVFVGGLWLAFVYFWNRDLTAVILAHFLLNIIFIAQFYQVFGL